MFVHAALATQCEIYAKVFWVVSSALQCGFLLIVESSVSLDLDVHVNVLLFFTCRPCLWLRVWGCEWTPRSWSFLSCRLAPLETARPLLHLWNDHPWWSAARGDGPHGWNLLQTSHKAVWLLVCESLERKSGAICVFQKWRKISDNEQLMTVFIIIIIYKQINKNPINVFVTLDPLNK